MRALVLNEQYWNEAYEALLTAGAVLAIRAEQTEGDYGVKLAQVSQQMMTLRQLARDMAYRMGRGQPVAIIPVAPPVPDEPLQVVPVETPDQQEAFLQQVMPNAFPEKEAA